MTLQQLQKAENIIVGELTRREQMKVWGELIEKVKQVVTLDKLVELGKNHLFAVHITSQGAFFLGYDQRGRLDWSCQIDKAPDRNMMDALSPSERKMVL